MAIEKLADAFNSAKSLDNIKRAALMNLPRAALLKPAHAASLLQGQHFSLGDRVMTVIESGSVPMCAKGTVVGISVGFLDVVYDVQFINGTNLSDR